MKNMITRFVKDEQGQDLIEYTLLTGPSQLGPILN